MKKIDQKQHMDNLMILCEDISNLIESTESVQDVQLLEITHKTVDKCILTLRNLKWNVEYNISQK